MNMTSTGTKLAYSLVGLVALGLVGWYLFEKNVGTLNIPDYATPNVEGTVGAENLPGITAPDGFAIKIYAENLPGARAIEFDPRGRLLISQTKEGRISVIQDTNNDNVADYQKVLAQNLNNPHGMAFECNSARNPECHLYVAESDALYRYFYDSENATVSNKEKLIDIDSGATDRHNTRSITFLPQPNEKTLLISVGSSCDVCDEGEKDHGKIISYNIDTKAKEVYATGLRNAVFMTLDPVSGKVFATEMGRDNLGDNLPPDEINIIEKGKNYGWPICYGKNIHDTNYDKNTYIRNPCMEPFETPSFVDLQAHSAPLGLAFIPEEGWAEDMWYDLLVSYHGSWNRSIPTGYKVVRLKMDARGNYQGTEDFITGWLNQAGQKTGRPVDIKALPGGVAYITDDQRGVVYRLSRTQ